MPKVRVCSRAGCLQRAVATLTYAYRDSTAVVGPLAIAAEPHSYDLCEQHAKRLTVPRGWEVLRYEGEFASGEPTSDEIIALAEAVREAGRPERADFAGDPSAEPDPATPAGRRGHLRALPNPVQH